MKMKRPIKLPLILASFLLLLWGAWTGYTHYTFRSFTKKIEAIKLEKMAGKMSDAALSDDSEADAQPKGVAADREVAGKKPARSLKATEESSTCTPIYEKYVAGKPFTQSMEDLNEVIQQLSERGEGEENACILEVSDRLDLDRIQELFETCKLKLLQTDESKMACIKMLVLGWGALTETRFSGARDLADVPDDALHARILYRLIDRDHLQKSADEGDNQLLFSMLDEMQKRRPGMDYGSTREELIAELYGKKRELWRDDYQRVLGEAESRHIARAATMFYRANGKKLDESFLAFADELVQRHPDSPWAHYYRGCGLTGLRDWDAASQALLEAERLEPGFRKKFGPDLRKAITEKNPYMYTVSNVSVNLNIMPGDHG